MITRAGETGFRSLLSTVGRSLGRGGVLTLGLATAGAATGVGILLVGSGAAGAVTAFTPGDVVVYRVGTGTGALGSNGTAAFLDEYTPAGTFVESIALPTTTSGSNKPLVASGTATSEGLLTLSPNGQYLTATGYDAAVGASKVGSSTSASTPRTVAIVNSAASVNTTTALTDAASGNNVRSAVTSDGTNLWVGGAAGGVRYTTVGSSTSTEIVLDNGTTSFKNVREVNIANGQLYTSADPTKAGLNVATVGSGLPTSGSITPANLPGMPTSAFDPYEYSFLTLGTGSAPDTLYIADNTAGVVDKFNLISGTWTAEGSVSVPGVIGVAANDDGNGNVTIDASASNSAGTSGTLSVITDNSGLDGTLTGSATTPVTLPANEAFRGVTFAPGTVLGSGGGIKPPPATPTITVAHSGLPAAINDPTNPTDTITVSDPNYPASQLTVTASSSNTAVAPQAGISISGSGATQTLSVTPGSTVGYSTITLTVTAPDATQASTTVTYGLSANLGDPSDRYFSGAGNGSTAIDVGGGYMIVGDDENNILRLYNETQSGPPVKTFDFTGQLPDGTTEVDIEASARAGNTLYWLGSMSNSSSGKLEPARNTLFAATISGSGAATTLTYVGAYTGLQTDLINWDEANGSGLGANYFGFNQSVNGGTVNHAIDSLEVEGLEFAHGSSSTAYLAFRGPIEPASNRQDALVIPLTNINQLVTGSASAASFGAPLLWNLGGLGIREIRANADGSYLLIAGTADGTNTSFVLYAWDGNVNHVPLPTNTPLPLIPSGTNQGSWESIVSVPDPLTSGTSVQLLEDNGDTAWYGDTATSKDTLPADLQKDLGRVFTYAAPNPLGTTTTLTSSDLSASINEPVTLTATVAPSATNNGTPTGTVGFTDGGTAISGCTAVSLDGNGHASCPVSYAHAGSHSIGAVYSGDNTYGASIASGLAQTVNPFPVTVVVSADHNPAAAGQALQFTATLSSTGDVTTAGGTVDFQVDGSDVTGCSAVAVSAGAATCSVPTGYAAGRHDVIAIYSGAGDFGPADNHTAPYVETVTLTTLVVVDDDTAPSAGAANAVESLALNLDGSWTHLASVSTGGTGSYAQPGNRAVAVNGADDMVYAVNFGSDTISELALDPTTGALTLSATVPGPAGGITTIALAPADDVLYVGARDQIAWYPIGSDGRLSNGPAGALAGLRTPQSIAVSADGSQVASVQGSPGGVGTDSDYPATGTLTVSSASASGALSSPRVIEADDVAPTAVLFSATGEVLAGGYGGVAGYQTGGAVTEVAFVAQPEGSPVTAGLAGDGSLLYIGNSRSGQVDSYSVGSNGGLSAADATDAGAVGPFVVAGTGQAISASETGSLASYALDGHGAVEAVTTVPLGAIGQPSVAVYGG